jgi:hypothetical protein
MIQRLIRSAAAAAAVLVTVACGITDAGDADPCFRGPKTQDIPDDDVRIGILNDTGTPGLIAVFTGPSGQRQECAVRTDVAEPTNVVFRMGAGQSMSLQVQGPLVETIQATCVLTSDAFAQPDLGTPGNAFISLSMGSPSTAFCGQGFASAFFSSGGGADG